MKNINIHNNKIVISPTQSALRSFARNSQIRQLTDIVLEFYEVADNFSNTKPISLEGLSEESIQKFILLFSFDFRADLEFENQLIQNVYKSVRSRIEKSPQIPPFKTHWERSSLEEERFIFYGGGMDSSALTCLYPKAKKIILDTKLYSSYSMKKGDIFVKTNLKKEAFNPKGFVFWTQPFSIAPLIQDLYSKNSIFLIGSILGSSYLQNGKSFFDRTARSNQRFGVTGNFYHSLFNELNIKLYSPTSNLSEICTTKIALSELKDVPSFCQRDNGSCCYSCGKCLRKTCEMAYVNPKFHEVFNSVVNSMKNKPKNFDYFHHIYTYTSNRNSFIAERLSSLGFIQKGNSGDLELEKIYYSLESYFQDSIFTLEKVNFLKDFDIPLANIEDEINLTNYKI